MTETKSLFGSRVGRRGLGLFLALAAGAVLHPAALNALASGDSAQLELGQTAMTRGFPNAITAAGLSLPSGVAAGGGRIYVTDTDNHRVLWWTDAGFVNGKAADGVLGQADFTSALSNRGGATAANTLSSPMGVAVDGAGNVWVADTGNNRVLLFAVPAVNGPAANLVLGQAVYSAAGGAVTPAGLSGPRAVAVSGADIWVADSGNNRVLKYAAPAADGAAAALVLGQALLTTNVAAAGQAGLSDPASVAVDGAGDVWVADSGNSRVVRFVFPAASGVNANLVLGQADYAGAAPNRGGSAAQNTMSFPSGLALNGTDLWVADGGNSRTLKFASPVSPGQDAILQLGQADFLSAEPNRGALGASAASLALPAGVAVDGAGNVWIADSTNFRVLRHPNPAASGASADLTLGQKDFAQTALNTPQAQSLFAPGAVAVDRTSGRVYAADYSNNRVLWWNSNLAFSNGRSADGVLGQPDFTSTLPNRGGAAGAATLNAPSGVAVDAAGDLWVNDLGNSRLLRFSAPSADGQAASRVLGQPDFLSSGGGVASASTLSNAAGIEFDAAGRLWVADAGNNRVLRFTNLSVDGAAADFVLGQADLISGQANRGLTVGPGSLDFPSDVSIDRTGAVWVADTGNNRVLRFSDLTAFGRDASLVLGQTSFAAVVAGSSASGLASPGGVLCDARGSVWVTDSFNSRVLSFDAPLASGQAATLVLGQADFTSNSANRGAATPAANSLASPSSAFMDHVGRLWLADSGNNRVWEADALPMTALAPAASAVTGSGFTLAWTAVLGAQYVVVLSTRSDFSPTVSSAAQFGNSIVFNTLAEYTTYHFEVKLATETDAGYVLNTGSVRTLAINTPLAPRFTAVSTSALTAVWDPVLGASYTVVFSSKSDFSAIASSSTRPGATASFAGLQSNLPYYLRVKLSTEPDVAYDINTLAGRTAGAGTALELLANANASDMISVNWPYIKDAAFVVVLARDPSFTDVVSTFTTQAGITVGSFAGLTGLTSYYFEMKVATETDSAYALNSALIRTPATGLLPGVTGLSSSGFTLSWSTVTGANYVVVLAADAGFTTVVSSFTQTAAWSTFSGLGSDTVYYYQVKLAGEGDAAFVGLANNGSVRTDPMPLLPLLTAVTSSRLDASWVATGGGYNVVLSTDPLFGTFTSSTTEVGNTKSFTGLSPYTDYYLRVKQVTASDAAYAFSTATARTLPEGTPLAPAFTAVSSNSVAVSWTGIAGANFTIVLARDPGYTVIASSAALPAGQSSESYVGLAGDTTYYFEMKVSTESELAYLMNRGVVRTPPSALAPTLSEISPGRLHASWAQLPSAHYVAVLASDPWFKVVVASLTTQSSAHDFVGLVGGLPYYLEVKVTGETDGAFAVNRVSSLAPAGNMRLSAVSPDTAIIGPANIRMAISGSGIEPFSTIKLTKPGQADVVPTDVVWQSSNVMTCTVLQPLTAGKWSVVVMGPGGTGTLPDAFAMLLADPNNAKIYQGVFLPGRGQSAQLASSLLTAGDASIRVYDSLGRSVKEVFSGFRAAGPYLDRWDGRNAAGESVASGVYLVRFEAPGFKTTKRVVVVK